MRDKTAGRDGAEVLRVRVRHQASLARPGPGPLAGADLATLIHEAATVVAAGLGSEQAEVLEHPTDGTALLPGRGPANDLRAVTSGRASSDGARDARTVARRTLTTAEASFLRAVANLLATAAEHSGAEQERDGLAEQVGAERAARVAAETAEVRYRHLFERAADAVLVIDADGQVVDVNPAASQLLGYTREEFRKIRVGQGVLAPVAWEQEKLIRLRREGYWSGELEFRRRDGSPVAVDARVARVDLPTGTVYRGAYRDISERREQERLERAFEAEIAQELRAQLSVIRGYADRLRGPERGNEPTAETIINEANRLERLVDDLLDRALLEAGRLQLRRQPVDLIALARDAAERARRSGRRHTIKLETPGRALVGRWDQDRLGQVFARLLGRAIQVSPDGGEILVRIEDHGDTAEVSTRDGGPGIPARLLPHLFDRFGPPEATVGEDGMGAGPGLSLTRAVIEAHGGMIGVASEPGQGTTFTVTLPFEQPPSHTTPAARLTRRELEVAVLIAEGKTNAEVASELVLSAGTVANYVHRLLTKLDLSSRTQLAAWVVARGLRRPGRLEAD